MRLVPLILLAACAPTRGDDDDSGACDTTLRICATYSGTASSGWGDVRTDGDDPAPLESALGEDGCVDVPVAEGDWEWRARHATDTCWSSWTSVSVPACETTTVEVELIEWCFDGR